MVGPDAPEGNRLEDSFYEAAKAEIARIEGEISRLGFLRQYVKLYEANKAPSQSPNGAEPPPARTPTITTFTPSLREAIHFVLSAGPEDELKMNEIKHRLVARGWLRSDENGRVNLAQMLSRMAKEETEIVRARPGWYRAIRPFGEVTANTNQD